MKIYTKKGDKGTTSLFNGLKVKKSNKIIEALGSIDELNAILGTLEIHELEQIQRELMLIASHMAGYKGLMSLKVQWLEGEIDKMQESLPELKNFILPKGPLHMARAVCRRAERQTVAAGFKIKYLNRLSDYLFVLARYVNFKNGIKETVWNITH